jgi:hypothetical protein
MIRYRLFSLLLFVFSAFVLEGQQDSGFYFSSRVIDAESRNGIPFASVSLEGTLRKTICNEKGEFSIFINKRRSVLEITSAGYLRSWIAVPAIMQPENFIAPTPTGENNLIQNEKIQAIFNDTGFTVIDYDFYSDKLLLLVYNVQKKYYQVVFPGASPEKLNVMMIRNNPTALFTNCYGNIFILKEEKVCPLIIEGNNISAGPETDIRKFEKEFVNCVAIDSVNIYYGLRAVPDYILNGALHLAVRHRSLSYILLSKEKKQRSLFKNLSDEKNIKLSPDEKTHLELNMNRLPFSYGSASFKKVYCPVFQYGSSVLLFDLIGGKIENFDSTGKYLSTTPVIFHTSKQWSGEVYPDKYKTKFYTAFHYPAKQLNENSPTGNSLPKPAWTELKEISLADGKTQGVLNLAEAMPFKMKVHNGSVYYLKRENEKTKLLRIPLPQ